VEEITKLNGHKTASRRALPHRYQKADKERVVYPITIISKEKGCFLPTRSGPSMRAMKK
jgi:hypothetical protein